MDGSGHYVIWCKNRTFCWRYWTKPPRISEDIRYEGRDLKTDLPNAKRECLLLNHNMIAVHTLKEQQ